MGDITFRGWCNRQHIWFWSRHWGFESSPPSAVEQGNAQDRRRTVGVTKPPSSSGLGHHPLKVAARVRIPLGVLQRIPCNCRGFSGFGLRRRLDRIGKNPPKPATLAGEMTSSSSLPAGWRRCRRCGFTGEERPVGVAADEFGQVVMDGVEHEPGENDGALARFGLRPLERLRFFHGQESTGALRDSRRRARGVVALVGEVIAGRTAW